MHDAKEPRRQPAATAPARQTQSGALASRAAASPQAQRLQALQRQADAAVLQREVDTGSSPFLPTYARGETPAWDDGPTGIPEIGRDEFLDAPITLIASMTPDGMIGSVYFPEGNRVRTTHASGPIHSNTGGRTTHQFSVSRQGVNAAFKATPAHAEAMKIPDGMARRKALSKKRKQYIKNYLRQTVMGEAAQPSWVNTYIQKAEDAIDTATAGLPDADTQLYEIYLGADQELQGSHPSRGAAVQLPTTRRTAKALRDAAAHVEALDPPNEREANDAFYAFLAKAAPDLAQRVRKADEVKYRPKRAKKGKTSRKRDKKKR